MTAQSSRSPAVSHAVAAVWGAAEATAFFIVPDVWLSRVAMRSRREALAASVSAVAGAVAGGIATYAWARRTPPEESREALRKLPAISGEMVDRCVAEIDARGNRAMLTGPLRGVPYKLYARAAGVRGLSLPGFALWSIPARIPRFLAVSAASSWIHGRARARLGENVTRRISGPAHAAFWVAFYAWYLNTVGREDREAEAPPDLRGAR
ncbi:MAG: hypothetical protein Q4G64_04385 [bacterium]|nr:hypothetical protein [bacterium]